MSRLSFLRDWFGPHHNVPCNAPLLGLLGTRTDADAINIPYKAKSQTRRILTFLAAGQELSAWTLITQLKATNATARGREVRIWLRSHGFTVVKRTVRQDTGARVLFWKLAPADRPRLRAALKQTNGSK